MNPTHDPRARVFISCGQARGTDEQKIATDISCVLKKLGFDPYVAVAEQSLRGLKENLFEQLRKSEYFLFINFKRKGGSLFSHQELAIASFLDLKVLALQEKGLKLDGILGFLQANAHPFEERDLLAKQVGGLVADLVRRRKWVRSWRNELVLNRRAREFTDRNQGEIRYFHIDVYNRHHDQTARNCYVFLEKVRRLGTNKGTRIKAVELKWAGTTLPNVAISPGTARSFDAFFIRHKKPTVLQFKTFADSPRYKPDIKHEGTYEFTYLVTADNFPPSKGTFRLNLNSVLNQTMLSAAILRRPRAKK
jgi:hypothetical protein